MNTKAKRAAALGYGLAFLLVAPPADGIIGVEDAGHALSAYQFDMPSAVALPEMTRARGVLVTAASSAISVQVRQASSAIDARVSPASVAVRVVVS
jgi:hypothetical protein